MQRSFVGTSRFRGVFGYLIQQSEGIYDIDGVFAGMFVLSAFVILIDLAVTRIERCLLAWRSDTVEEPWLECLSLRANKSRERAPNDGLSRDSPDFLRTGLLRRFTFRNSGAPPPLQSSHLTSSDACGGVLIAIALNGLPSGLVPACAVPLGMMTRSPGFTWTSLSPSQIVPVPSRIY